MKASGTGKHISANTNTKVFLLFFKKTGFMAVSPSMKNNTVHYFVQRILDPYANLHQ